MAKIDQMLRKSKVNGSGSKQQSQLSAPHVSLGKYKERLTKYKHCYSSNISSGNYGEKFNIRRIQATPRILQNLLR